MTLRDEAVQRKEAAQRSRAWARRMARKHQAVHYALGILATVVGGAAAGAGVLSDNARVAGLLGLGAGVLAGVQTLLRPQRMVHHHWTRFARLGRLSEDYSALINGPDEPTRAELAELAARNEDIDRPPEA